MQAPLEPEFARVLQQIMSQLAAREVGEFQASQAISELGLDSVSLAEVIAMLEDHYDVSLDLSEIETLETFGHLQELLQRAHNRP